MAVTVEAGYIKMTAQDDVFQGRVEPTFYKWVGPAAAGDECVVKNNLSGAEVYHAKASGANVPDIGPHSPAGQRYLYRPKATTLASGILEIHFASIRLDT